MTTLASCARRTAPLALVMSAAACAGSPGPHATAAPSGAAPSASPSATADPDRHARSPPPPHRPTDTAVRPGEPWLVYQGGTGGPARIRLVRPDGTGDHVLVPDVARRQPRRRAAAPGLVP